MQERLIVKNFGPIRDVDLDLRKTTIFIGEQASGKSTLAKLIGMFRFPYIFDKKQTNEQLLKTFKRICRDYGMSNFLRKTTLIKYKSKETEIDIIDLNINIIENDFNEKGINSIDKLINSNDLLKKRIENVNSPEEFLSVLTKYVANKNNGNILEELANSESRDRIYIPAERILIPIISNSLFKFMKTNTSLPVLLTNFGSLYEGSRNYLKKYYIKFLNVSFSFDGTRDIITQDKISFELKNSSTGLQAIVPMMLVLEFYQNYESDKINTSYHYIIEEPELNLYPTTQHDLMKFIVSKCTKENQNLTITTHSPYILSTLNVLLMAYQAGQEHEEEVSKIIPKESWLNPDEFNIYFVEKAGIVRNIFDRDIGLIDENGLDDVSLDIGDEFDQLMNIYSSVPA